jgi:HD-GYP domain-containing protein (c-di-GMP phosphodiesterase class II)
MQHHPQYAYDLMKHVPFLKRALDIPYCHHEHWDGSGYPRGLKGEEIPLSARIFSVIDNWDALTSERAYRVEGAWPREKTLEYIQEQVGKLFDPDVVKVFVENFEKIVL